MKWINCVKITAIKEGYFTLVLRIDFILFLLETGSCYVPTLALNLQFSYVSLLSVGLQVGLLHTQLIHFTQLPHYSVFISKSHI